MTGSSEPGSVMPDSVVCPSCKVRLKPQDSHRGRTLRCPKCGQPVAIPSATAAIPAAVVPPVVVEDPAPVADGALPVIVTTGKTAPAPRLAPASRIEPASAAPPVPISLADPEPSSPTSAPGPIPPAHDAIVITTTGAGAPPRVTPAPARVTPPQRPLARPRWLVPAGLGAAGIALFGGVWLATRGRPRPARLTGARSAARAGEKAEPAVPSRGRGGPPAAVPAPALAAPPADTGSWLPLPVDFPGVAVRFPVAPVPIDPVGHLTGPEREFAAAASAGAKAFRATADDRTFTATITPRDIGDATAEFHLERALANLELLHPGFACAAIYQPAATADWRDAVLDGAGRRRIVRLAQGADVAAALVVEGPADMAYDTPVVQGFFQSLSLPPAPPVAAP